MEPDRDLLDGRADAADDVEPGAARPESMAEARGACKRLAGHGLRAELALDRAIAAHDDADIETTIVDVEPPS